MLLPHVGAIRDRGIPSLEVPYCQKVGYHGAKNAGTGWLTGRGVVAELMVVLEGALSNDWLDSKHTFLPPNVDTSGVFGIPHTNLSLIIFANLDKPRLPMRRSVCSYPHRFSCKRKWRQPSSSCPHPDFVQAIMVAIIDEYQPTSTKIRSHQHRPSLHDHGFKSVPCRQQVSLPCDGLDSVLTSRKHVNAHHKIERNFYDQISA